MMMPASSDLLATIAETSPSAIAVAGNRTQRRPI
jgi:hypothetical protein